MAFNIIINIELNKQNFTYTFFNIIIIKILYKDSSDNNNSSRLTSVILSKEYILNKYIILK